MYFYCSHVDLITSCMLSAVVDAQAFVESAASSVYSEHKYLDRADSNQSHHTP